MNRLALVGMILLGFVCSGCIESNSVLVINKDGSGILRVSEFYSPQFESMMQGMQAMAAGMHGTDESGKPLEKEPADFLAESVKQKLEAMGPAVSLKSEKRESNAKGWRGYEAEFSFKDVNDLNVNLSAGQQDEGNGGNAFVFKFTPGPVAKLEITPTAALEAGAQEHDGETSASSDEAAKAAMDMGAEMMQMMAPMFQGMRITFAVEVNGTIQETNSRFRSKEQPGRIVVVDLPMDKVLGNSEAMAAVSGDSKAWKRLSGMNLDGVVIEPPDKTVSVTFK